MLQPWYQVKYKGGSTRLCDTITVTYRFHIDALPTGISLALEDLEHIRRILINSREIPRKSSGKWIDICFDKIPLPDEVLCPGANTITLVMDYYSTCGIEAVYLLGEFGVTLANNRPTLTTLPETITIGDITPQGLPFYSGAITYHIEGLQNTLCSVTAPDFGGCPPEAFRKRRSAPGLYPSQGSHPGPERHPADPHPPEHLRPPAPP